MKKEQLLKEVSKSHETSAINIWRISKEESRKEFGKYFKKPAPKC